MDISIHPTWYHVVPIKLLASCIMKVKLDIGNVLFLGDFIAERTNCDNGTQSSKKIEWFPWKEANCKICFPCRIDMISISPASIHGRSTDFSSDKNYCFALWSPPLPLPLPTWNTKNQKMVLFLCHISCILESNRFSNDVYKSNDNMKLLHTVFSLL